MAQKNGDVPVTWTRYLFNAKKQPKEVTAWNSLWSGLIDLFWKAAELRMVALLLVSDFLLLAKCSCGTFILLPHVINKTTPYRLATSCCRIGHAMVAVYALAGLLRLAQQIASAPAAWVLKPWGVTSWHFFATFLSFWVCGSFAVSWPIYFVNLGLLGS